MAKYRKITFEDKSLDPLYEDVGGRYLFSWVRDMRTGKMVKLKKPVVPASFYKFRTDIDEVTNLEELPER